MIRTTTILVLVASALLCPNEKNCRACDRKNDKNVCADCYLGWVDANGNCAVFPVKERLDHCTGYEVPVKDIPNKCNRCDIGFFLENGKCSSCQVDSCGLCPTAKDCHACSNGKKLQLTPEVKCLDLPSDVANCYLCDYFAPKEGCKCRQCNSGWVINPNAENAQACVQDKIGSCQILDKADLNRCAYCIAGYYVGADGKCWNNNKEVYTWLFWLLLALVIIAIPLIWFCVKKRKEHSHHDHYHQAQPIVVNNNQPYSQRLVN